MTSVLLAAAPRRRTDVFAAELGDDTVVFVPPNVLCKLDAVGSALWQQFDGTTSLGSLIDELSLVYPGAARSLITGDVLAYVERLTVLGLIEM